MARANKPYSRPPGGSDGAWTHDAYQASNPSSLSARLWGTTPSSSASSSSARRGRNGTSSGSDLLSRIAGGQGKELISAPRSKGMLGFQASAPANINNVNSGLELLPAGAGNSDGRLTASGTGAGAGAGAGVGPIRKGGQLVQLSHGLVGNALKTLSDPRPSPGTVGRDKKDRPKELFPNRAGAKQKGFNSEREGYGRMESESERYGRYDQPTGQMGAQGQGQGQGSSSISVMGRSAPKAVWVRVDNLALGTTPDDVVAAFAPAPILSARSGTPSNPHLVCVEVELATPSAAEGIINMYDGVVADGNTLKVEVVRPSLSNRLAGGSGPGAHAGPENTERERAARRSRYEDGGMEVDEERDGGRGRELMGGTSSKMYSDGILASNPTSHITTLASDDTAQRQRASAWSLAAPHVAHSAHQEQRRGLASRVGGGARW